MRPEAPQGYPTPPEGYTGAVYLESQMKAYARECEKEILRKALHGVVACGHYYAEQVLSQMLEDDE